MDAGAVQREAPLVAAARAGDEAAFRQLIEPHQGRLTAHCYRMLGSLYDAEDAVQETLVKAWRGLGEFDGRSQVGSWLYRIATTTCLNELRGRERRALPLERGFRADDPREAAGRPLADAVWIEPFPDLDQGSPDPAARYELRESVELALVAAWQLLPANQRAALLLIDVLGYTAKEAADTLGATTGSLNSALQRARAALAERVPARSQQATMRELGDRRVSANIRSYISAMESADVGAVVGLLRADATWSMPPQPAWFAGREAIADFLRENPFSYFHWRYLETRANGQPAVAAYSLDQSSGRYLPHGLNVLTFAEDGRIAAVTTFLDITRRGVAGFRNFAHDHLFERFGLPAALD